MIESIFDKRLLGRTQVHAALSDPHRLAMVDELARSDRSPSELRLMLRMDSNLLAHHLDVLDRAGLIERSESQGDRRRRYLRLMPEALEGLWVPGVLRAGRVVFVCTENAARSQLAAALWNDIAVEVAACSGGTRPREEVHPEAVKAAERRGLNLAGARPAPLPAELPADLLITVCDRAHETLGDRAHVHWTIPDPVTAAEAQAFDQAADLLQARIQRKAPLVRSA